MNHPARAQAPEARPASACVRHKGPLREASALNLKLQTPGEIPACFCPSCSITTGQQVQNLEETGASPTHRLPAEVTAGELAHHASALLSWRGQKPQLPGTDQGPEQRAGRAHPHTAHSRIPRTQAGARCRRWHGLRPTRRGSCPLPPAQHLRKPERDVKAGDREPEEMLAKSRS